MKDKKLLPHSQDLVWSLRPAHIQEQPSSSLRTPGSCQITHSQEQCLFFLMGFQARQT